MTAAATVVPFAVIACRKRCKHRCNQAMARGHESHQRIRGPVQLAQLATGPLGADPDG